MVTANKRPTDLKKTFRLLIVDFSEIPHGSGEEMEEGEYEEEAAPGGGGFIAEVMQRGRGPMA